MGFSSFPIVAPKPKSDGVVLVHCGERYRRGLGGGSGVVGDDGLWRMSLGAAVVGGVVRVVSGPGSGLRQLSPASYSSLLLFSVHLRCLFLNGGVCTPEGWMSPAIHIGVEVQKRDLGGGSVAFVFADLWFLLSSVQWALFALRAVRLPFGFLSTTLLFTDLSSSPVLVRRHHPIWWRRRQHLWECVVFGGLVEVCGVGGVCGVCGRSRLRRLTTLLRGEEEGWLRLLVADLASSSC